MLRFILVFSCFFSSLSAFDYLAGIRTTYFLPSSDSFKSIYGKGMPVYGAVFGLFEYEWGITANIDWLNKKGDSIGLGSPTHLNLIPIGVNLVHRAPLFYGIEAFASVGPELHYIRLHDEDPLFTQYSHKWGYGGAVRCGLSARLASCVRVELIGGYALRHANFSGQIEGITKTHVNASGWEIGLAFVSMF